MQLLNSAFVGYEEFYRSWKVLSTSASVDNTLQVLQFLIRHDRYIKALTHLHRVSLDMKKYS